VPGRLVDPRDGDLSATAASASSAPATSGAGARAGILI